MRGAVLLFALAACGGSTHNGGGDGGGGDDTSGGSDATPGSDATHDASPTHAISIIVEPDGMRAAQVVTSIMAATSTVDMTMYELSNDDIIGALMDRASHGVTVRAILDGSSTNMSFNMDAYTQLTNAGAHVVWSNPLFTYTHEKAILIDQTSAWIMTMNATQSAPTSNREYLALDTEPDDVAEAETIFAADFVRQGVTPSGDLVVANTNARTRLVQLISSAQTSIDLEGEEYSDSANGGIVDAIVAAANRGVTVHVVLANDDPDAQSVNRTKGAGAHVVITGPDSSGGTRTNPYIHSKAIVIDCNPQCASGFVGSENFSTGSLSYNRELGVIFDNQTELAKVKAAIDTDFAAGTAQ
ncbi:MAG TPA: phospholipase D-like domain-containing protein [Kofleriaceae bacterium]|jgi:phosphatidylserine/phosphatidylglycerophosphate/cardiolipin synthase-like enzyme